MTSTFTSRPRGLRRAVRRGAAGGRVAGDAPRRQPTRAPPQRTNACPLYRQVVIVEVSHHGGGEGRGQLHGQDLRLVEGGVRLVLGFRAELPAVMK